MKTHNHLVAEEKTVAIGQGFSALEAGMYAALETYANVHRGSGHYSQVTTHLYEKAREIVLDYLGLNKNCYILVFTTPLRLCAFKSRRTEVEIRTISSQEIGLNLGVAAIAFDKSKMPDFSGFDTGGGTTRLYGADWVMWAAPPDRFEAGTPPIINIIAFAKALAMSKKSGKDIFRSEPAENLSVDEILFQDKYSGMKGSQLQEALRTSMPGSTLQVPTSKGRQAFINLDNSASTPAFWPVWETFRRAYRMNGNARSAIITEVKKIIAELLDAPLHEYDIIFTSNTTEAINLLARGLRLADDESEPAILSSVLEHSSNDLPWRNVPGHSIIRLAVDNNGFFDVEELEKTLKSHNQELIAGKKRIKLLALNGASNVLGSCNDLEKTGRLARKYGAQMFIDAAQLVAHRRISMKADGIDSLAFSGHKTYAPFGTGVLIVKKQMISFDDLEWQKIQSSGEENTGGIAALGKALLLLQRIGFDVIESHEHQLNLKTLSEMEQIPGLKIHGLQAKDSEKIKHKTGVIGFEFKNRMSSGIARRLAQQGGIGVRYGCLCAHLIIKQLAGFTPFQEKIQKTVLKLIPMLNLQGITRLSFGIQNTENEVDLLISELKSIGGLSQNQLMKENAPASKKVIRRQISQFIQLRDIEVFGENPGR
jgi:selenocysteine lyase/cysteine desulfurase